YKRVGVDLLLLQSSPQLEEMERFAETVMPLVDLGERVAQAA
ncbi:MAG: alkanesulfonate monooxygenase, partial [Gemmatimonadaceae bacterium]